MPELLRGELLVPLEGDVAEARRKGVVDAGRERREGALIGARAKLLQHWADRIDTMIDGCKVVAMPRRKAAHKVGV